MLPYYALAVFVGVLAALSRYTHHAYSMLRDREIEAGRETKPIRATKWSFFDYLIVIALICFSALRSDVGSDFGMYTRLYQSLLPNDWDLQIAASPQEIGYTILSLWLKIISDSPHLVFWVSSTLTVVPVYATIKKKSADPLLSVLLYILLAFFVSPFNIIRQGIAVALNFWANSFIDKNKKAFVLINAVAASFHTSVVIVAVVQLVIHKWKPSVAKIIAFLILAVIAAAGLHSFTALAGWLDALNGRYDTYIGAKSATSGVGTYMVIGATLALLIYSAILGNAKKNGTFFIYVLMGVAFLIVGTQAIAISRMELYFGIFLILLVPNQLQERSKSGVQKVLLVAAAAVYFGFYLGNYGGLVPYQTYLAEGLF